MEDRSKQGSSTPDYHAHVRRASNNAARYTLSKGLEPDSTHPSSLTLSQLLPPPSGDADIEVYGLQNIQHGPIEKKKGSYKKIQSARAGSSARSSTDIEDGDVDVDIEIDNGDGDDGDVDNEGNNDEEEKAMGTVNKDPEMNDSKLLISLLEMMEKEVQQLKSECQRRRNARDNASAGGSGSGSSSNNSSCDLLQEQGAAGLRRQKASFPNMGEQYGKLVQKYMVFNQQVEKIIAKSPPRPISMFSQRTSIHTYIHTYMITNSLTHSLTYSYMRTYIHIHTYIHTYIHTIFTYILTIHTYIHTR